MQKMVEMKARGIYNKQGLYKYTEEEAKKWDDNFAQFNQDIYKLDAQYPFFTAKINKNKF